MFLFSFLQWSYAKKKEKSISEVVGMMESFAVSLAPHGKPWKIP
jgi:hypothetical protein